MIQAPCAKMLTEGPKTREDSTMSEEARTALPALYRDITAHDFATWGLHDIAYVRKVDEPENEDRPWAIFAADGTCMGLADDRDVAVIAVRQNDLEPFSVH